MQEEYKRFDLVIVGGGLVGASLAAIIARDKGLQVAVIERYPASAIDDENITHPSYDARTTAVANGSCHIFSSVDFDALKTASTSVCEVPITPLATCPNAITIAPVSVAISTTFLTFFVWRM